MTTNLINALRLTTRPVNGITPFTYRDGKTYLEILEALRDKISELIEGFGEQNESILAFQTDVSQTIADLTAGLDVTLGQFQAIIDEAKTFIDDRDEFFAGLLAPGSDTYDALTGAIATPTSPASWPLAETLGQRDLFDIVSSRCPQTSLQMHIMENQELRISSVWNDRHVTWTFAGLPSGRDDYRTVLVGYSGATTPYSQEKNLVSSVDAVKTGAWEGVAPAVAYTTEVGATYSQKVVVDTAGDGISVGNYVDNRGGVFEYTLKELPGLKASVSTYAATSGRVVTQIFPSLPAGTYTVVGTFKGPDAANPPSGGTARGWSAPQAAVTASNFSFSSVGRYRLESLDRALAHSSNRDFALRVRAAESSEPHQWVPFHSGVPTAHAVTPPEFYLDGKPFDLASKPANHFALAQRIDVVQHIVGRMPGETQDLIEVHTTTSFTPGGKVRITGTWKALTDLSVAAGYVAMLPGKGDLFDRVVTSRGQVITNHAGKYGTSTRLADDTATSFAMASSSVPGAAVAMRVLDVNATIHPANPLKPVIGQRTFIEHRDAGIVKMYNRVVADNSLVPAGYTGTFAAEWVIYESTPINADII